MNLIQLQKFPLSSENIIISDIGYNPERKKTLSPHISQANNVLIGNYHVILHDTSTFDPYEPIQIKSGNLFILHQSYLQKMHNPYDYSWQDYDTFDVLTHAGQLCAGFFPREDYIQHHNENFINSILKHKNEQLVDVTENGIVFSFLSNGYHNNISTLVIDNKIVGIKIDGLGFLPNTLERQLENACKINDLEAVRDLLTSPISKDYFKTHFHSQCFFHACDKGHEDIIKYLMFSPEIENHFTLDEQMGLCFQALTKHPNVVRNLILEHYIPRSFILNGVLRRNNLVEIEKLFSIKNMNDKLEKELSQGYSSKKNKL